MKPIVGDTRCEQCTKTKQVFLAKLGRVSSLRGRRLLDVGCGDGTFTIPAGQHYEQVCGIDIQEKNIAIFRSKLVDSGKFHISVMSASQLAFPSCYFDTVLSIEAFEHIEDAQSAASECHRVLVAGGELVVTVPNRWFPCENHGGKIVGIKFTRLPLVTYFPWLHDRVADARVYTVSSLDRLFVPKGFTRTTVEYLWPTFEHGGNPLQPLLRPLFPVMRALESSEVKFFGTSIVARYVKVC